MKSSSAFQKAYENLNAPQKEAVDTIFGPVMVVAGPGTGKTQLLAVRTANILLKTDTTPESILCITFTNAGVISMRERLWRFLGPDAARVSVFTFHDWCNSIIRRYPEDFSELRARRTISDVEKYKMISEFLRELPRENPLYNRNEPDMYLHACIQNISNLKRENITPDAFRVLLEKEKNTIDGDPELRYKKDFRGNKAGDPKPDYFRALERVKKNEALADLYEKYRFELRKNGQYDTDDMISHVLENFSGHPFLLQEMQEKYQFVMVDEYQDTNASQNALVHALFENEEQPNVLVVGDDDQAIYRFQGANISNILSFREIYKNRNIQTITLTENYRSGQNILDASRNIARGTGQSLEQAEGLDKTLHANIAHPGTITAITCPTETAELWQVCETIRTWNASGIDWKDIAIIATKNSDLLDLADTFRRSKIPFRLTKGERLFEQQETIKLLTLLRLVWDDDDTLLWMALRFDFFKIPEIDILQAESNRRDASGRRTLTSIIKNLTKGGEDAQSELTLFPDGPCRRWAKWLADLRVAADNLSPTAFFEWAIEHSGYRPYALSIPDRLERLSVLAAFFDLLKAWQAYKAEEDAKKLLEEGTSFQFKSSLKQFHEYLQDLQRFGLSPDTTPIAGDPNGVQLLTAHGSKGLEFEAVLLFRTTDRQWEKSKSPSLLPLAVSLGEQNNSSEDKEDDKRRLFFVAMTRAKTQLALLWAESYTGKPSAPSRFILEIPENYIEKRTCEANSETAFTSIIGTAIPEDILRDIAVRSEIAARAARYELSPTALNEWIKSPRSFLEKHILRSPSEKGTALTFGTAIHSAIEFIAKYWQENKACPTKDEWIDPIKKVLKKDGVWHTEKERLLRDAEAVIMRYLQSEGHHLSSRASHEQNLSGTFEGIKIKGKLDRIEYLDSQSVVILDYKTGKPKEGKHEESYIRQLDFYRLLWITEKRPQSLAQGVLDYIEAADGKSLTRTIYAYDDARLERLKEIIRRFQKSLAELDFPEESLVEEGKKENW